MPADSLIKRLPRHLKMSELRVFVAVLEHRSFRKAAAAVHLSQPAVTKAIAGLEEMLSVKLFHRNAFGVEPTAHGLSFAPRAIAVFEELRRAAQDLESISSGAKGSLRVGTVSMPAIPFLPIAIKRLVDAQPGIFVSVVESIESDLLDRLRRRDIEVAILRLSLFDPDEDLQVNPLFSERLCIVAGRDHPLAQRSDLTWDELLHASWVMPPPDCYFFEHVLRVLDAAGLALPRNVVESFSIHIQYGMVLHGGLLSFGMRSQFEFAPEKSPLVRLPFELPSAAKDVGAVSLISHRPSPLALQLIAQIHEMAMAV
jgi:DNA-binding transcriptional LysR family regulator